MASTVTLYNQIMSGLSSVTATSAESNRPVENMFDNNLYTIWKGTSTAQQAITMDFGSAIAITGAYAFVRNYGGILSGNTWELYYSSNGSDFFDFSPYGEGTFVDTTTPHRIMTFGERNFRYWRMYFSNNNYIPQITMLALLTTKAITIGNQFPEDDTTIYSNVKTRAAGGQLFVRSINQTPQIRFSRTYMINGTTNNDLLQAAFDDSFGSLIPIIIQEGSTQSDLRVVRFLDDELKKNEIEYQMYKPTVNFETLPYDDIY